MLFLANDVNYYLIDPADLHIAPQAQPDSIRENIEAFSKTVIWAETFLCNPHPQLGRTGAVCPYTESSLKNHYFWLTACRGKNLSINDVYDSVMKYRDWFLELEPLRGKEAQFKTILILFPDVTVEDAPQIVDVVQQKLKPDFVAKGLMIGQFHPSCLENGLWNPDFRPLQSPIPMLAIRHMVLTDLPFLKNDARFLSSYIKVFGNAIPQGVHGMLEEARLQLCKQA